MSPDPSLLPLLDLLKERRALIANHEWRDRDPAGHLSALEEVSGKLLAEHDRIRSSIQPRLQHYLTQCSYDKAAAWIESGGQE